MTASADIFAVRTGRATVLIGPPAALGEARGELLLGRERESAQHIDLALEACRASDAIRQYCARWGLDTNSLFYLDDLMLRAWLVAAVRYGHLGVALLPDVLFSAGAVQGRVTETRARISARIDVLMRSPAGAQLARQPDKLIAALQSAARGEDPLAAPGRAAPERHELTPAEVQAMALEDRMLELLRRALTSPELGAAVNQDIKALLDPQTLATAIAVLTAWAATDAGKPAPLIDLALLAFGQVGLDATLIEGLKNLAEALERTRQARHAADLTWATKRLVVAIALLRPRDLIRLIARGASNPYGVPLKTGGMKTRNKGTSRTPPPEKLISRPAPADSDERTGTAPAKAPASGSGGIEWKKQPGATDEDLAKAKEMWEKAKARRMADGSKPATVKAMEALETSDKKTVITVGPEGNAASPESRADSQDSSKGCGGTIKFNPHKAGDYSDGTPRDPECSLAHEAYHAHEYTEGRSPKTREGREVNAGSAENQHRKAKGIDQRKKYGSWDLKQY